MRANDTKSIDREILEWHNAVRLNPKLIIVDL